MGKWFAVAGGVVLLGGAVIVALALRTPESPPSSGWCPFPCGKRISTIEYGMPGGDSGLGDAKRIWLDGSRFVVQWSGTGRAYVWGGEAVAPAETGAVCLSCRRTWVLETRLPLDRSIWWRLRGGLMRLL